MHLLDNFYTNPPKLELFHPRKLLLPEDTSFLLTGARASGKSALVIDYINRSNKKFLYIDCQDPLFILEELTTEEIEAFIQTEHIHTLVLDHYFKGFLERLPNLSQLIIVSREKIALNFRTITLYPLDFEEFINFKHSIHPASNFDLYTKFGSLPRVAKSLTPHLACREIFFEKFDQQEGKVLLIISLFQAKNTTPHQIYQVARDYFKISKDWLYRAIEYFLTEGILYQIDIYKSKVGKKFFLYDFLFSRYLNKNQTFLTTFDSLIALALIKHNIEIKALLNPLGYLHNNMLIIVAPFENEEQLWAKIQTNFANYTQLPIDRVEIVTVSSSYNFQIKNITFNAQPFYEWVVTLNDLGDLNINGTSRSIHNMDHHTDILHPHNY